MISPRSGTAAFTARHAVQTLAAEQLLYRVTGRGTFVAQPRVHRHMNRLLSFSDEMRRRGVPPSSKVLVAEVRPGSDDELLALELSPGERVVVIERQRLADQTPMAIETVVLPGSCAAVLMADLATGSLHDALSEIGRVPATARGTVTAELATAEDAELLGVEPGAAVLVQRLVVLDRQGRPLERTVGRYAGERYVFDVELEDAAGS